MIVEQFQVRDGDTPGEAVLVVFGEVDLVSRDVFVRQLAVLVDRAPIRAVVDMTDVAFMDSTGVHALLGAAELARERGTRLEIRTSPQVRRVLELLGLVDALNVD